LCRGGAHIQPQEPKNINKMLTEMARTSQSADNKMSGNSVAKKKVGVQRDASAQGARILICTRASLLKSFYSALRLSTHPILLSYTYQGVNYHLHPLVL
jgi:hypothetical protein